MNRWFQYENLGRHFCWQQSNAWAAGLLIELDETPIGVFLELEGPATAIDRAAKALGFEKRDYILANYMVLYRRIADAEGKRRAICSSPRVRTGSVPLASKNVNFFS